MPEAQSDIIVSVLILSKICCRSMNCHGTFFDAVYYNCNHPLFRQHSSRSTDEDQVCCTG